MKPGSVILKHQRLILILLAVVFGFFAIGHLYFLNNRIALLETSIAEKDKEIAELGRERCSAHGPQKSNATIRYTIQSSGGTRTYRVETPAQFSNTSRTPMVIVFSGKGSDGASIKTVADFHDDSVLSVYPDPLIGTDGHQAWQGAPYSPVGVSDVRFVRDMMHQISANYCVDSSRIYTVGMSNGGGIAWLSACYMSDTIAATATISGAYYGNYQRCPENRKPLSILAVHGKLDQQVPYKGDLSRGLPPVTAWVRARAQDEGCVAKPSIQSARNYTITTWEPCAGNSTVTLVSIGDGPHGWMKLPDVTADPNLPNDNLTGFVWEFLRQHRRV